MKTVSNGVDPFYGDGLSTRPPQTGCRPKRSTTRVFRPPAARNSHISIHSESSFPLLTTTRHSLRLSTLTPTIESDLTRHELSSR